MTNHTNTAGFLPAIAIQMKNRALSAATARTSSRLPPLGGLGGADLDQIASYRARWIALPIKIWAELLGAIDATAVQLDRLRHLGRDRALA